MSDRFIKIYRNSVELGGKSNNFNAMRIILAISVLLSHSFELLLESSPVILGRSMGNFAVNCFFVISGYFITKSWIRADNALVFIKKRVLRLLPAYILALILARMLAYIGNDYLICPTPYIRNGSVWTLYYEIMAYLLVMVLGMFGLIKPDILGALWGAGLFVMILMDGNNSNEYTVLAPLFLNFLGGAYISQAEQSIKMKRVGVMCTVILFIIQFFPKFFCIIFQKIPLIYGPVCDYGRFNYFLFLLCIPFAVIYIGKYLPVVIEVVGDISYGIYIYAWPVQQIIIYFHFLLWGGEKPMGLFVEALLITIIISIVSYVFVERKINSAKIFTRYSKTE